jgi:hypothetical protein
MGVAVAQLDEQGGSIQSLVRQTMLGAGGYWRPLAAVARLLEELGELGELLDGSDPPPAELSSELADLWIITTALADQFLAPVAEPSEHQSGGGAPSIAALLEAAGPIARIVNHYDGPKLPRAGTEMPSLAEAVHVFHGVLARLAAGHGVELDRAIREKIEAIHRRGDMQRFARSGHDPSTAGVLKRLPSRDERLWGAPDWPQGRTSEEQARELAPSLLSFAKAARAERLEGYAIAMPAETHDSASLAHALLSALAAHDPSRGTDSNEMQDDPAPAPDVAETSFNGVALSVELQSPEQGADSDAPNTETESFMLLRPLTT